MNIATQTKIFQFCPNCKSEQIQTENGHKYLCNRCQFEYFHNTASAVGAIICCADEMLFTVRAQDPHKGKLDLPGGFVDHNESLEVALSRELKEELDVTIDNWQYFYSGANTYLYKDVLYHTCDVVFVCQLPHKPCLTADIAEITEFKWLKFDEIDCERIAFASLRKAVQKFLKRTVE